MRIYRSTYLLTALLVAVTMLMPSSLRASQPRLVVNLVVSGMRAADLERYEDNFCDGGFRRLLRDGIRYRNAHYDYMLTSTAAGLATLSTGTQPSAHGALGERWWSYVDGSIVTLVGDSKSHPVKFSTGSGSYSSHRLMLPTTGDMLLATYPEARQVSIAVDALSAIVINGKAGTPYWAEKNRTHWTTSSAYLHQLPEWIERYNEANSNRFYALTRWTPLYAAERYHNSEVAVVEGITGKPTKLLSDINLSLAKSDIGAMCYTPAGNTMLLEFASSVIAHEKLGADDEPDMLNIVFDTSRYIAKTYGPESIEYEDMLYRLDSDLAEFLTFLHAQMSHPDDIVVVLTSDHGTSPSFNPVGGKERERFNVRQMEVIVNAYLGAHYGSDNYVLGFANNSLYLNHTLLLKKRLSIEAIREEVAVFMLQLRGVATALSATALRNTSFADGRSRLMQQSFSPTRSGDVVIDLQAGWIIEDSDTRSSSDGGYNYDRSVPLVIYGGGVSGGVVERATDITELAPTLCALLGITDIWASEAKPLKEVINR